MPNKVERIRVSAVRYGRTGYEGCKEQDATNFSVGYLGTEKGYGKGWFPAYDLDMKYQYGTKQEALSKGVEFQERHQLGHIPVELDI